MLYDEIEAHTLHRACNDFRDHPVCGDALLQREIPRSPDLPFFGAQDTARASPSRPRPFFFVYFQSSLLFSRLPLQPPLVGSRARSRSVTVTNNALSVRVAWWQWRWRQKLAARGRKWQAPARLYPSRASPSLAPCSFSRSAPSLFALLHELACACQWMNHSLKGPSAA